jgi:cell division protein FtsQ
VVICLLLGSGLGWLLLRHGWSMDSIDRIVISGDSGLRAEQVAQVGQLSFPQPLFQVSPAELERQLLRDLPVKSATVERRLHPARIEVHLLRQTPVARATRQQAGSRERGMVDADGRWIPLSANSTMPMPLSAITVHGWRLSQRPAIAQLLQDRNRFQGNLQTITVHPDGGISLRTSNTGRIDLGQDRGRLDEQIDAIVQLRRTLPPELLKPNQGYLDLTNPDRPELQLPVTSVPNEEARIP